MGKERPTLSQAEKKRLAEEKQAEKKAAMTAEREARKEQLQHAASRTSPPWLTNAAASREPEGAPADRRRGRRRDHRTLRVPRANAGVSKALEKRLQDAAGRRTYINDFLLEAPCELQTSQSDWRRGDDGLYDIVSNIRKDEPTAAVLQVQEAPLPLPRRRSCQSCVPLPRAPRPRRSSAAARSTPTAATCPASRTCAAASRNWPK